MTGTDRGTSTMIGYTLTLGISAILISGLLVTAGAFVDNQRERTVRDEMKVLGQQVAADVTTADRLVQTGATDVKTERRLPGEVTGAAYSIEITDEGSDNYRLTLQTTDPQVTVTVGFISQTPVAETTINGGDFVIEYDGSELEVTDA